MEMRLGSFVRRSRNFLLKTTSGSNGFLGWIVGTVENLFKAESRFPLEEMLDEVMVIESLVEVPLGFVRSL